MAAGGLGAGGLVLLFLRDIEGLAAPNEFEPDFYYRMQWLPYVGQAAHGGVRPYLLLGHARRWANGERPDQFELHVRLPGQSRLRSDRLI